MRDLKHLIFFENLLDNADNELVEKAKADGGLAIGYTCFHIPEVLLNVGQCFSVRLRAPRTGSVDIATYYMSNYTCEFARALVERGIEGGFNFLDGLAGVDACSMMNRFYEIVKTAIAVFLCLMIYALRGYEVGSMPTEAAITAIICMQPYVKDAGKYALDRLTGSLIGTVWSLLFLVVLMNVPFLSSSKVILYAFMSLGVLLSIYTAVVFRIADTAGLAAIIYICVIAGYPDIDDPLRSAAIRIFDINVGALVAILVNTTHSSL